MEYSPDELRLIQLFFPYAFARQVEIQSSGRRFVHYCSADAAVSMLSNKEVWMRKSSVMNDFMEIDHGINCLNVVYNNESGEKFRSVLNGMFPNIVSELEDMFRSWVPHFRMHTYLTCISEHDDEEDTLGRLSMWRAYGGVTGVAIVLNPNVFLSPSNALKAYTSPVAYLSPMSFAEHFKGIVSEIENSADFVQKVSRQIILDNVFHMLRFAILCTKHPGFHEEREWRIIYSPTYEKSDRIRMDHASIRGIPQPICKIPLEDVPEEGLIGASIPGLVNRVIIGPTLYPSAMYETFVRLLQDAGVAEAESKVCVSDIPLRTA